MRYLYYTLYRLILKIKTNTVPAWNAMILLSLFEGLNIQAIMLLLPQKIENQFKINNQVTIFAIAPMIILVIINYFLYVKNSEKIKAEYDGGSQKTKTIGIVVLIAYVLASIIALFAASPV